METIVINVANKRPSVEGNPTIVCNNDGYLISFNFDAEWDGLTVKTARFAYNRGGLTKYQDCVFEGTQVEIPELQGITEVFIGVFAGDIKTTTPARIPCELSIRCKTGAPEDPTPDQYDQIIALCNEAVQTAKSVEERANSGEFDGEKGAPGTYADFTEAEKADLVNDVINALPKWEGGLF